MSGRMNGRLVRAASLVMAMLSVAFAVGCGGESEAEAQARQALELRIVSLEETVDELNGIMDSMVNQLYSQNLTIVDGQGNPRIVLQGDVNGAAMITVRTPDQQVRWNVIVTPEGDVLSELRDSFGEAKLSLTVNQAGEGRIVMFDPEGRMRVGIGTLVNGSATIGVTDPTGALRAAMMSGTPATGGMAVYRADQTPQWFEASGE